jgi:hypothetical protein
MSMTASRSAYVNLKYLSEFNKYTMALGAAAFLYFDKFESGFRILRTGGAILSAVAVVIGVLIMSALGRIHGADIDYEHETDQNKIFLFRIISRALLMQLAVLLTTISAAGWLSLAKIWK